MSTQDRNPQRRGVVVGFDGSGEARRAVQWAADEAARRGCPLVIATVLEPPRQPDLYGWSTNAALDEDVRRERTEALTEMADEYRDTLPNGEVTAVFREGHPVTVLSELTDEADSDLLVLGSSGQGAVSRLLLGSTAAEATRAVDVPVVVVRDPTRTQQSGLLTGDAPVVVGVDGTEANERAIDFAFGFADRHGCPVNAVHARADIPQPLPGSPTPEDATTGEGELTDLLEDTLLEPRRRRHPTVPVRTDVVSSKPTDALLERSEQARLLVVGSSRHGVAHRVLLGSVSHAALYHAACPVALVPDPAAIDDSH